MATLSSKKKSNTKKTCKKISDTRCSPHTKKKMDKNCMISNKNRCIFKKDKTKRKIQKKNKESKIINKKIKISSTNKMKIISWNVNGLRGKSMDVVSKNKTFNQNSRLGKLIKNYNPDILCLCETKCQKEHEELFRNILPFKYQVWNSSIDRLGYSGVAVLSKIPPINKIQNIPGLEDDIQGRYIVLEYEKFILIYAYVPNSGTSEKYRKEVWDPSIKKFLEKKKKLKNKTIIYAGDLNVVDDINDIHNPEIIKKGKNPGVKEFERQMFKTFITPPPKGLGFHDALRKKYKDEKIYTWWDPRTKGREKNRGWRLDYFLVSDEKKIKDAQILNDVHGSDHCPIYLEI